MIIIKSDLINIVEIISKFFLNLFKKYIKMTKYILYYIKDIKNYILILKFDIKIFFDFFNYIDID